MVLFTRIRNSFRRRKATPAVHPLAREMADALRPLWPPLSEDLRASGAFLNEGAAADADDKDKADDADKSDDADAGKDADADKSDDKDKSDADADDADKDSKEKTAEQYRKELRSFERSAKRGSEKAKKTIAELEKKLKDREDEDKSDHEKAIEKAKEDAKAEALTEIEKERRSERLELRVTRLARKGVKVGEGDDEKTYKFADEDDAMVYLERAIARGDVDIEDLFDDGKVKDDAVKAELADLLEEKAHLRANNAAEEDATAAKGGGDGGKGKGSSGKSLEDMTPDDHLKAVRRGDS